MALHLSSDRPVLAPVRAVGCDGCMKLSITTTLVEQEAIVEHGLASFVEVGNALMAIRDGELYREDGFDGFVEYLESKPWGIGRTDAYQQINAAKVVSAIGGNGSPTIRKCARRVSAAPPARPRPTYG